MNAANHPLRRRLLVWGFSLCVLMSASVGCQVNSGGQTLPSAYANTDDVQYFAPGSEQKLQREAAAQKAYKEEQARKGLQAQASNNSQSPRSLTR